jgi:hypothetical protein
MNRLQHLGRDRDAIVIYDALVGLADEGAGITTHHTDARKDCASSNVRPKSIQPTIDANKRARTIPDSQELGCANVLIRERIHVAIRPTPTRE